MLTNTKDFFVCKSYIGLDKHIRGKTTNTKDNNAKETTKGSKGNAQMQKVFGSNSNIYKIRRERKHQNNNKERGNT